MSKRAAKNTDKDLIVKASGRVIYKGEDIGEIWKTRRDMGGRMVWVWHYRSNDGKTLGYRGYKDEARDFLKDAAIAAAPTRKEQP